MNRKYLKLGDKVLGSPSHPNHVKGVSQLYAFFASATWVRSRRWVALGADDVGEFAVGQAVQRRPDPGQGSKVDHGVERLVG